MYQLVMNHDSVLTWRLSSSIQHYAGRKQDGEDEEKRDRISSNCYDTRT